MRLFLYFAFYILHRPVEGCRIPAKNLAFWLSEVVTVRIDGETQISRKDYVVTDDGAAEEVAIFSEPGRPSETTFESGIVDLGELPADLQAKLLMYAVGAPQVAGLISRLQVAVPIVD